MKRYFTIVILSICIIACEQNSNKIDQDKERLNEVCDKFMKYFQEGNTSDALQLLKRNTVMTASTVDTLQVTIENQMNVYFPSYGKMISSEFIVERRVKDFIVQRHYILRFEKYFLQFQFTLYKTDSGWRITNFKYNEELIELLY